MEPQVTDRDVALLLMSEASLLAFGAVLGWRARAALGDPSTEELPLEDVLPV